MTERLDEISEQQIMQPYFFLTSSQEAQGLPCATNRLVLGLFVPPQNFTE